MPNKPHRLTPKKRYGQHFLADGRTAQRIVDLLEHQEGSTLIEIGPGEGVLTERLLAKGYTVTAVEVDDEAISFLQEHLTSERLSVVASDILAYTFPSEAPLAIIGNLPYNISSPIFFKLLEQAPSFYHGVFMLQREVAERIAAGPGSKTYGILSVLVQHTFEVRLVLKVPPGAFRPPPKVDSAVITMHKRDQPVGGMVPFWALKHVVKAAFGQRRKTLRNALSGLNFDIPSELASQRAEQLTVAQFVHLAQLYQQHQP